MQTEARPVFLVGASRSGTAMVRSALNNTGEVHIATETHFFDDLRPKLADAGAPLAAEDRRRCADYLLALTHRPYGHQGDPEQGRMSRADLDALAETLGGSADAYFEAYCRLHVRVETDESERPRWGEKTPRHIFRLNELLTTYPTAQAVCMIRDGRAVVASYRDWKNQGGFDFEADPGHAETLETEQDRAQASYHPIVASMLWRGTVGAALQARSRFGEDRVRVVRYEDVVRNPESELKGMTEWLGLTYSPKVLEVPLHNSSVARFSRGAGVSQDPLERWREKLGPGELAVIERVCGSVLTESGYEPAATGSHPFALAAAFATLPLAVIRAARANRDRIPNLPAYLWRRLRMAKSNSG